MKKTKRAANTCGRHGTPLVEMTAVHPLNKREYKTLDCPACLNDSAKHDNGQCEPSKCQWCRLGNIVGKRL